MADPSIPRETTAYGDGLGIEVRAVYIDHAEGPAQPVVLVAADLVNLCPWDTDLVRDPALYGIPGLTRERILINISHTHTAPVACDTSVRIATPWLLDPNLDQSGNPSRDGVWRDFLRTQFVEVIRAAYANRQPATLVFHRGKLDVGINRRTGSRADLTDAEGTALANGAGYDQTLDVVTITGTGGIRRGVLFFYGMHPIGLQAPVSFPTWPVTCSAPDADGCSMAPASFSGDHYHHPDYPGFARKTIEDATPGIDDTAIFFQAAGGDVNPATGHCSGYCFAKNLGTRLGQRVLNMISAQPSPANSEEETLDPIQGGITAYDRVWAAPLQTAIGGRLAGTLGAPQGMDGNAEHETPAEELGERAGNHWGIWASHYCDDTTGHGGDNLPCAAKPDVWIDTSWDVELQTVSIGKWRVAGLSHEPSTRHGLTLRQAWPNAHVSAVGYINREQNYLPTSAQLDEDDTCMAADSCTYGRVSGRFGGYEGFAAQLLNGNPSAWATYQTTAGSATGSHYDLDEEIAQVLQTATSAEAVEPVNYAAWWHGTTAGATSTLPGGGRTAEAAINGDRKGIHWGSDPETGSGWHDASQDDFTNDVLTVDFHAPRTIHEIDVFSVQNDITTVTPIEPGLSTEATQLNLVHFDVQYLDATIWSAEGTWVTVANGEIRNNTKAWRRITFPPVTTTKIRIVVLHASGHYSRIAEVEAWGLPTARQNVALASKGATADASTSLSGRTPEAAINGDRLGLHWGTDPATGSGWHDTSEGDFGDDWLEVTFPRPRTINQVDLFSVQNVPSSPADPRDAPSSQHRVIDFHLKYWDGNDWVPVPRGSVTGNDKVWCTVRFAPITTTMLRVYVTDGGTVPTKYSRIVELEALTPYDFLSSKDTP